MEDIKKFENYTEDERDNGLDSKGKPIMFEDRYPELAKISEKLVKEIIAKINVEAEKVVSKSPYKAQGILEYTIQLLEKLV